MASKTLSSKPVFSDPPFVQSLLSSPAWSWLWLIMRLYVGYQWIEAGLEKAANPAWTVTGAALKGFWTAAIKVPEAPARPPISFEWYRAFIQMMLDNGAYTWFAKLVVFGEIAIGIALVLGLFTGIAAFFGGFLNWNFMMAGSASTNPMLFVLSVFLILAWKTAGWLGLDRWVLPLVGTPWQPGKIINKAD
jgi:thiosulfate dehydrogenase (quinone) large subunit